MRGEKRKRDRTKHLTFSGITTIRDIHSVGSVWLFISASSEHCRGVVDTCVLSDNWSEGRGGTAWPTRRQRRWQRQWQRQRHGYIILSTVLWPWQCRQKQQNWEHINRTIGRIRYYTVLDRNWFHVCHKWTQHQMWKYLIKESFGKDFERDWSELCSVGAVVAILRSQCTIALHCNALWEQYIALCNV